MKATIFALAAAVSLGGFASGAYAMTEFDMVQDTLKMFLIELKIPTDKMDNLTMAQMREIITIVDSHEMGDAARAQVLKIIGE